MEDLSEYQFQILVENWKKKYKNDHEINCTEATNYIYCTSKFISDILSFRKVEIESDPLFKAMLQFINMQRGLSELTELDLIKIFSVDNSSDIKPIGKMYAEYKAIIEVWSELISSNNELKNEDSKINLCLNVSVISKIDFIRLINTMYEMKAFLNKEGLLPEKKQTMEYFGCMVGLDLRNYHTDLNNALSDGTVESNIAFFEKLIEKMNTTYHQVLERKKGKR